LTARQSEEDALTPQAQFYDSMPFFFQLEQHFAEDDHQIGVYYCFAALFFILTAWAFIYFFYAPLVSREIENLGEVDHDLLFATPAEPPVIVYIFTFDDDDDEIESLLRAGHGHYPYREE
jgi:hypothetical protein